MVQSKDESSIESKFAIVVRAILVGLLCGIICSLPLWLTAVRDYPLIPILGWWPSIQKPLDLVILFLLAAGAVAKIKFVRSNVLGIAVVLLLLVLLVGDWTRCQPWVYQYTVMLTLLTCSRSKRADALDACRIIIIFTYVWSGVQKLNSAFCVETIPWLLYSQPSSGYAIGIPCAVLESALGIGLIFSRSRRIAAILITLMHISILYLLDRHHWNLVVFPWNLVMPVLIFALFWESSESSAFSVRFNLSVRKTIALLLFGLMPVLNFFGLWDSYVSLSLYSGNLPRASLLMSEEQYNRLPERLHEAATLTRGGRYELDTFYWCLRELNVAPYAEVRIYRRIAQSVLKQVGGDSITLVLKKYPRFFEPAKSIPWTEEEQTTRGAAEAH